MASASIGQNGKALYAYTGSEWVPLNGNQDFANVLRWHKIASGGETSLSGLDSDYNELIYTPGYEQVYLNGILLVKDSDYTAINGTSITGLSALNAGDVIDIIALNAINIANIYTKSQSDARYLSASTNFLSPNASANFEPNIEYTSASPSGPSAGTLWIDSTNSNAPALKVYNGSTWIAVSGASETGLHPFFQAGI